jgi:ATP-dependent DNA helicase RecG
MKPIDTASRQLASQLLILLPGVGPKLAAQLNKLGIQTVQDLLFHLPLRYQDRSECLAIAALKPGMQAVVIGNIVQCESLSQPRSMLLIRVADATGFLTVRFFHVNAAIKKRLTVGSRLKLYGEVCQGGRRLEMLHPEWSMTFELAKGKEREADKQLTPIYPTTKGLRQATWRKLIYHALTGLQQSDVAELLPPDALHHPMTLFQALQFLHHPPADVSLSALERGEHPAMQRLIIEELLAHQLSRLSLKATIQSQPAYPFPHYSPLKQQLLQALPFQLTSAQSRVVSEIEADLEKKTPMIRLLQGDVGSGKTLVAALTALKVVTHGKQVALMAPTELLAEQHAEQFQQWFAPLGITVARLMGYITGQRRRSTLMALATGEILLVVGTQALFQQEVQFKALGLVIIDEQHRFGVQQRLLLWEKGAQQGLYPHQLVMTATPIPRTLAMTVYADLACSYLDELPPGRQPINTIVVPDTRRDEIIRRVAHVCEHEQRQVYWVCTLIETSELLAAQAAEQTAAVLRTQLPNLSIGLVHGRMRSQDKQATLQAFRSAEIQVLVATLVIEIGVDVPHASLMIIENAERLGLAQLHQLRGRVGRGTAASHCILLYQKPLNPLSKKRLAVLRSSQDGFEIAQRDLELRGPGELLGTRQTGDIPFRIADLIRDQSLFPRVQQLAQQLQRHHPTQAKALIERWLPHGISYTHA